jgi:hypothetical protein
MNVGKRRFFFVCRLLVEVASFAALLYFLFFPLREQILTAKNVGNTPSARADAGSEADAINSAMHYYKLGFLANQGLPDRGHPAGRLYLEPDDTPSFKAVYTHYPPGPNWLTGLAMMVFGPKQIPLYRSFGLSFSVLALFMAYFLLRSVVGCFLSSAAVIVLLQIPLATEMMHGLYGHSYALALAILQMSFVFNRLETRENLTLSDLFTMSLLSFLQGWMSFDWAFVSMFHGLCIVSCWGNSSRRKNLLRVLFCSMFGFGFAHFLHFCQVWAFYGKFMSAFGDLLGAAIFRSHGEGAFAGPSGATKEVLSHYLFKLLPSQINAKELSWIVPTSAIILVALAKLCIPRSACGLRSPRLFESGIAAIAFGFIISIAWLVVMRNHAMQGGHMLFLPRHFIALLYSCILAGTLSIHTIATYCYQLVTRTKI